MSNDAATASYNTSLQQYEAGRDVLENNYKYLFFPPTVDTNVLMQHVTLTDVGTYGPSADGGGGNPLTPYMLPIGQKGQQNLTTCVMNAADYASNFVSQSNMSDLVSITNTAAAATASTSYTVNAKQSTNTPPPTAKKVVGLNFRIVQIASPSVPMVFNDNTMSYYLNTNAFKCTSLPTLFCGMMNATTVTYLDPNTNASKSMWTLHMGMGGFVAEWNGYFAANVTGSWQFSAYTCYNYYLWIYDPANPLTSFTEANAVVKNITFGPAGSNTHDYRTASGNISLTAGVNYVIRMQLWANATYMCLSVQPPGKNATNDFSPYLFSATDVENVDGIATKSVSTSVQISAPTQKCLYIFGAIYGVDNNYFVVTEKVKNALTQSNSVLNVSSLADYNALFTNNSKPVPSGAKLGITYGYYNVATVKTQNTFKIDNSVFDKYRNAGYHIGGDNKNSAVFIAYDACGGQCYMSRPNTVAQIESTISSADQFSTFDTVTLWRSPSPGVSAIANQRTIVNANGSVTITDDNNTSQNLTMSTQTGSPPSFSGAEPETPYAYLDLYAEPTASNANLPRIVVVVPPSGTTTDVKWYTINFGNDCINKYKTYAAQAANHNQWLHTTENQYLAYQGGGSSPLNPYCAAIDNKKFITTSDSRFRLIMQDGYLILQMAVIGAVTAATVDSSLTNSELKAMKVSNMPNTMSLVNVSVDHTYNQLQFVDVRDKKGYFVPSKQTTRVTTANGQDGKYTELSGGPFVNPMSTGGLSPETDVNSCITTCTKDANCVGYYTYQKSGGGTACQRVNQSSTADYVFSTPLFNTATPSATATKLYVKNKQLQSDLNPNNVISNNVSDYSTSVPTFSGQLYNPADPQNIPSSLSSFRQTYSNVSNNLADMDRNLANRNVEGFMSATPPPPVYLQRPQTTSSIPLSNFAGSSSNSGGNVVEAFSLADYNLGLNRIQTGLQASQQKLATIAANQQNIIANSANLKATYNPKGITDAYDINNISPSQDGKIDALYRQLSDPNGKYASDFIAQTTYDKTQRASLRQKAQDDSVDAAVSVDTALTITTLVAVALCVLFYVLAKRS